MPREEYENLLESVKSLGDINEMGEDEMDDAVGDKLDAEMDDDEMMDDKLDVLKQMWKEEDDLLTFDWIRNIATDEQIVAMYNRFIEDEMDPVQIAMHREYLEELVKASGYQAEEMYLAMGEIGHNIKPKTDRSRGDAPEGKINKQESCGSKGMASKKKKGKKESKVDETLDGGGSLHILFKDLTHEAQLETLDYFEESALDEDFVVAIWKMLNQPEYLLKDAVPGSIPDKFTPRDYIVGTGIEHSLREFVECAFEHLNIAGDWVGHGEQESFIYRRGPRPLSSADSTLVSVSSEYYRPAEVNRLIADYSAIKNELGWNPTITFEQLVQKMVFGDLHKA